MSGAHYVRLAVGQSIQALALAREFVLANRILDRIERTNALQRFVRALRLDLLCLEESSPGVRPALGVGQTDFFGITRVGRVAAALRAAASKPARRRLVELGLLSAGSSNYHAKR